MSELVFEDNSCVGDEAFTTDRVNVEPWDYQGEARLICKARGWDSL